MFSKSKNWPSHIKLLGKLWTSNCSLKLFQVYPAFFMFVEMPLTKGLLGFAEPSICAELRRGKLLHRKATSTLGTPCVISTSSKTRMGTSVNPAVPILSVTLQRWRWDNLLQILPTSISYTFNVIFFWGANVAEIGDHAIISVGWFFRFRKLSLSAHIWFHKTESSYMPKCGS